ncbi:MAG TPA: sulfite exporter TauE/SafE family protein, partial [Acidimicrobiia bacterium]|nr:sulfite exporter TauE/SafE family protein [Acidimicrobiia bacterium]
MHLELGVMLAGLLVGLVVGLTGMGGGALMTPILVLLFRINPLSAVSSDIVAAVVMKPVGGSVHARRGTVNVDLVRWLALGSVPAAFCGVFVLRAIGAPEFGDRLKVLLGAVLLVAAAAIVAKGVLQARRPAGGGVHAITVRPGRTVLIGVIGGLVVGMTSVGSGSVMIVLLLFLYPALSSNELVGTDLVQA